MKAIKNFFREEIAIFKALTNEKEKKKLQKKIQPVIKDITKGWKAKPLRAIGIFIFWFVLMFAVGRGINYTTKTMNFCDIKTPLDEYPQTPYYEGIKIWNKDMTTFNNKMIGAPQLNQEYNFDPNSEWELRTQKQILNKEQLNLSFICKMNITRGTKLLWSKLT